MELLTEIKTGTERQTKEEANREGRKKQNEMRTEMEREKEALNQIFRGSCGLEIKLWSWIEYRFKFCLCQLLTVCLGKVPSLYCASVIPSINWRWNSSCSVIF